MPLYDYGCDCGREFAVFKKMSEHTATEVCDCGKKAERIFNKGTFYFNGASDWNSQTYNYGLGCEVRNQQHARQIAKSRGLEEVGNDDPKKIGDIMEKDNHKKWVDGWNDTLREKVYE